MEVFDDADRLAGFASAADRQPTVLPLLDRTCLQAYREHMSDIPTDDSPGLDDDETGPDIPADALSPVIDPDLVPGDAPATAEEKRARVRPEETGS